MLFYLVLQSIICLFYMDMLFFLQCPFCLLVFLNFKSVNVKSFNSIYRNLFFYFYFLVICFFLRSISFIPKVKFLGYVIFEIKERFIIYKSS